MAGPVDLTTDVAALATEAVRRTGPFFWDRGIGRYTKGDVTIMFEQLRTERRTADTTAEATVWVALPTGTKQIHRTRLNLLSTRTQAEVSRYLTERHPGKGKDEWMEVLEDATRRLLSAYREGAPMKPLASWEGHQEDKAEIILPGVNGGTLVTAKDSTILFSDGGAGKSLLALAIGVSLHTGRPLVADLVPSRRLRVAYLDFEWHPEPHVRRMRQIWGQGDLPQDFMYRHCKGDGPLQSQIEGLIRQVVQHRIEFVIIDSVGFAVDGDAQEASDVMRFFQNLDRLKCGNLLLAHKTKDKDATQYPFGSIFWHNSARVTWYVQGSESKAGGFTMGLYNRKANEGIKGRPFGLRLDIDPSEGWTKIAATSMAAIPEFADNLPPKERIATAIRLHGPQLNYREIRDLTSIDYKTIAEVCQREDLFVVESGGPGRPVKVALQEDLFPGGEPAPEKRVITGPWAQLPASEPPIAPPSPEDVEELKRVEEAVRKAGGRPPCPSCGATAVELDERGQLRCFRCHAPREQEPAPDPEPEP